MELLSYLATALIWTIPDRLTPQENKHKISALYFHPVEATPDGMLLCC